MRGWLRPAPSSCPAFEYALVDQALKWMVIENHHDILFAVGDARQRLALIRESG
jgi:hypothetical protein